MAERLLTRRERYRQETLAEIKQLAMRQIAQGGAGALSLNAIAKAMGMSGAALYRYFAGRDDLLAELIVDAYHDLADVLQAAAGQGASPVARFRAVTGAYRTWALAEPHRYRLVFSSPVGSGQLEPERVIPASQRSMDVFLGVLAEVAGGPAGPPAQPGIPVPPGPSLPSGLPAQLEAWHARSGASSLPPATLLRALLAWTRLHGVLSLELDGHLTATGIDPALLYQAEVDILAGRQEPAVGTR
jgi:AcrR family transcriptional regulator